MATPIHAPRINNNDDEVKVLAFEVEKGSHVRSGQIVGQIETDKAVLDIESPVDGYVLSLVAQPDDLVKVGSVIAWLGEQADEPVPDDSEMAPVARSRDLGSITAKARLLLKKHGLSADAVAAINGRITVEAVDRHLAADTSRLAASDRDAPGADTRETPPEIPGVMLSPSREERGMAATVAWHRDHPATGYIEIEYDLAPWAKYAKKMQDDKGWMMSPLLSLMTWRLVEVATTSPRLNSTMINDQRYQYAPVNLGFTIQAGETLFLAVLRDAASLDEEAFVSALGDLQRRAAGHKLRETETSGATVSFSSMERWKVSRHIPILPPQTSFIVAHAAGRDGKGVLGATYDHRVLNGAQVVAALKLLSRPASD